MVRPLAEYLKEIPDPRSQRKHKHIHVEVLLLITLFFGWEAVPEANRKVGAKKSKNTLSVLRKIAYNIIRFMQIEEPKGREQAIDVMEGFVRFFQITATEKQTGSNDWVLC